MTTRARAAALGAVLGLVLLVIAIIVFLIVGGPKAGVVREGERLSPAEDRFIFDARGRLANYCTQAISAAEGGTQTLRSPQAAAADARRTAARLIAVARRNPQAFIPELGPMRDVLVETARDVESPSCLPDTSARLRAEAARLPR